jgi:hypothetical protein
VGIGGLADVEKRLIDSVRTAVGARRGICRGRSAAPRCEMADDFARKISDP